MGIICRYWSRGYIVGGVWRMTSGCLIVMNSEVCHTSLSGGLDGSHLHEPRKDFPTFGIHTVAVEKMG